MGISRSAKKANKMVHHIQALNKALFNSFRLSSRTPYARKYSPSTSQKHHTSASHQATDNNNDRYQKTTRERSRGVAFSWLGRPSCSIVSRQCSGTLIGTLALGIGTAYSRHRLSRDTSSNTSAGQNYRRRILVVDAIVHDSFSALHGFCIVGVAAGVPVPDPARRFRCVFGYAISVRCIRSSVRRKRG